MESAIVKYFLFFICLLNKGLCQSGSLGNFIQNAEEPKLQFFNFSQVLNELDNLLGPVPPVNNSLYLQEEQSIYLNQDDSPDNRINEVHTTTSEETPVVFVHVDQEDASNFYQINNPNPDKISDNHSKRTTSSLNFFEKTTSKKNLDPEKSLFKIDENQTDKQKTTSLASNEVNTLSSFNVENRNYLHDRIVSVETTKRPVLTTKSPLESTANIKSHEISHGSCTTVENEAGICVPIQRCKPYMELLPQAKISRGVVELLRRAHCGFDVSTPKVCCPQDTPVTSAPKLAPTTSTSTKLTPSTVKSTSTTTAKPTIPDDMRSSSLVTIDPNDHIAASPQPPVCGVGPTPFGRIVGGVDAKLDGSCTTVENEAGICVPIQRCKPYMELLPQAKISRGVVELLRRAHCGFDVSTPKVCCPQDTPVTSAPKLAPTTSTSTKLTPSTVKSTSTTTAKPTIPDDVRSSSLLTIDPNDHIAAFPQPPVCGVSPASFSRIVGGVDAKLGDLPWMALLGYRERGDTAFRCGGSLLSGRHVLTAAHCIHFYEDKLYLVRLGELDTARTDDGAFPVDVLIKTLIEHEGYDIKPYVNDIGVLVLERDVQFTEFIRPICLPLTPQMRSLDFEDYMPLIAGWGAVHYQGPSSSRLQVLKVPVVSQQECARAYEPYDQVVKIDARVLCAGYSKGGKDSCEGDSGGPLMHPLLPNEKVLHSFYYAIGVISLGVKCAEPGYPGVYTRVTQFIPWLEKVVLGAA